MMNLPGGLDTFVKKKTTAISCQCKLFYVYLQVSYSFRGKNLVLSVNLNR